MEAILTHLRQLGAVHSCVGFIATALVFGIRLYKMPLLQSRIPASLRWGTLTPAWQFIVTLLMSSIAGVLTALSTGKTGWELVKVVLGMVQDLMMSANGL